MATIRNQPERTPSGGSEFTRIFRDYVDRDRRSHSRITDEAMVDPAYFYRLYTGDKRRPTRDVVIRLGHALKLDLGELDELLLSLDYAPITTRRT